MNYLHACDIVTVGAFGRQPDAIELVDKPRFQDLQHLVE